MASFAPGSLIAARLAQVNQVRADNNRVFDLRVNHGMPGKLATLNFADPAFQEVMKSEQTNKLVEKVDATYMHPWIFRR